MKEKEGMKDDVERMHAEQFLGVCWGGGVKVVLWDGLYGCKNYGCKE